MNDLFAPPVLTRETFVSRQLSIVPVRGDGMSPTLRGNWDYVLAAPVKTFAYDSLYVVEQFGQPCVYRCQSMGTGQIGMMNDNEAYGKTPADRMRLVPREWFEEHVLGIVVCDLKVRDPGLMQKAWEAGL
ncbi:hypothetical protein N8D56_04855 [Devosia sp. A8/3-2]|nr:hypothetical protein N8D56_04855 [Devosia sp. A8/3-2]